MTTDLRDDSCYQWICSAGHRNGIAVTNEKYELLFDMAAMAYLDGYGREAVATFAAALERFYEWGIRLLCLGTGIESAKLDLAWKRVSKQSERQLGAFVFLFLVAFKEPPALLADAEVGFRNAVIHQGYLPASSEVAGFAERVLHVILSNQDALRQWAERYDQLPQLNTLLQLHRNIEGAIITSTETRPTILNTSGRRVLDRHDTFPEALENMKNLRQMYSS
jgi:hypothetical protein